MIYMSKWLRREICRKVRRCYLVDLLMSRKSFSELKIPILFLAVYAAEALFGLESIYKKSTKRAILGGWHTNVRSPVSCRAIVSYD
jgi:hypothetical protein